MALIAGTLACGASDIAKLCNKNALAPSACPKKNKPPGFPGARLPLRPNENTVRRTDFDAKKVIAAATDPNAINKNPFKKGNCK